MSTFVILVSGLNIRAHNRIILSEQLRLLKACPELLSVNHAGDKGSYLVTTRDDDFKVVQTILSALRTQCSTVTEAAVCQPSEIRSALQTLTEVLSDRHAQHFSKDDFALKLEGENWRAGLVVPAYPHTMPESCFRFTRPRMPLSSEQRMGQSWLPSGSQKCALGHYCYRSVRAPDQAGL